MTRKPFWLATLFAIALTVVGGGKPAIAQNNSNSATDTKEAEKSASSSSNQGTQSGQSASQSSSNQPSANQSQSGQSGSTSSSASGSGSTTTQPSNRSSQGSGSTSNQQNQARPNQPARDAQQPQSPNNQARDGQNRDNAGRSGDRNNTNVNIGVGIQFGNVTDRGIVVTTVQPNSFFYTSGIRQGDVIVSVSGRPIRSHDEFVQFISVRRGERIPVIVLREGRQETIYVVYDGGPEVQVNVGNLQAAMLGVTFDTNVQHAAVIAVVHPGGPAAQIGLKAGDHIISISGRRVENAQNAIQVVGAMRPGEQVEIEFLRLQKGQIVLSQPGNVQASVNVGGQVGAAQGTYQANYPPSGSTQAGGQVQVNPNQAGGNDANVNRPQSQNQQNQPSNQSRSLLPRIRN